MHRVFFDVDVQRDFCEPTGALHVPGSPVATYRALTRYAMAHRIPIVGSVDSHAWDAWEFASNDHKGPAGEDPRFPDHCVKGTPGWLKVEGTLPERFRFVPDVPGAPFEALIGEVREGATHGVYFEKEVYSAFANPVTEPFLRALAGGEPLEFYVYGVATDYCVRAAALGLVDRGYRCTLLIDAVAGITPEGTQAALDELAVRGVKLSTAGNLFGCD